MTQIMVQWLFWGGKDLTVLHNIYLPHPILSNMGGLVFNPKFSANNTFVFSGLWEECSKNSGSKV